MSDSSNFAVTFNSLDSFKQLTEDLKMKLIDAYKAEEGCQKISLCFQLTIFTVQNVIKKWQLKRTVEVETRSR